MDAFTEFGMTVSNLLGTSAEQVMFWGGNFLILLVLFVIMIAFSYKSGRGGIISLILAMYAGYAIYSIFPYTEQIVTAGGSPAAKAVISIIIYVVATFLPFHFIQRLTSGGFGVLSFSQRFMLSLLAATFLMALGYHVFHVSNIYTFPEPMNTLFAPNMYFFWWFIAPLVGLLFLIH